MNAFVKININGLVDELTKCIRLNGTLKLALIGTGLCIAAKCVECKKLKSENESLKTELDELKKVKGV